MTFRLNLSDVPNADDIPQGARNVIACGFMFVGMPKITADNVDEWFTRATMHQTVSGPWVDGPGGPRMITYAEVCRFIGARANVSPMTDAAFRRWLMDTLRANVRATMHTQRSAYRAPQDTTA